MHALRTVRILPLLLLALAAPAAAQTGGGEGAEPIEVNGFFVEEAYNQEAGILQQIATFTAVRHGGWSADLSQEWPLFSERHQLDLALRVGQDAGLTGAGAEYRYLLTGGEDAVFSLSPGIEAAWSREEGEWELEAVLPASVQLTETLVANTNVGVSFAVEDFGGKPGLTVGEGLIWRAHPRLNLLVEAVWSRGEPLLGEEQAGEDRSFVVSPGLQYAFSLGDDVQLVPGIAFPVGVGPSDGQRAVMLYLSLEHPFRRGER
jgi:hypothetical protein